jgi:hypothetical protein
MTISYMATSQVKVVVEVVETAEAVAGSAVSVGAGMRVVADTEVGQRLPGEAVGGTGTVRTRAWWTCTRRVAVGWAAGL